MVGFDCLNENQRKAVTWHNGPLLVLAGPGSGKTAVLTLRVARIIDENEHAAVLALTFTNRAAAEMRERVDQLLGQRAERAHLCTFHSFAAEVLRQHGSHLGLRPDFSLLTQDEDRIAILEDAIAELPDGGDSLPTDRKNLISFVDRLFAESYDGRSEASWLAQTPSWVPLLYRGYCTALLAGNRLDFGSMLHFTRQLLEHKPGVARVLRLGWTHVCVDEFQDTNKAQYDLLRLIAPVDRHDLLIVADDDQIIYQWNGASPKRLQTLRSDYKTSIVQLPECYRCPEPVVALANRLIGNNSGRVCDKVPISARSTSNRHVNVVREFRLSSPNLEAEFVANDIAERRLKASDCVVLGRTARLLDGLATTLNKAGYEAHVVRRKSEFESPTVRLMVESLRLANARHDRDILRRLCLAWDDFVGATIEPEAIAAAAALVGGDFLRAWADTVAKSVSGPAAGLLAKIRSDLVDSLAFPNVVDWFVDQGWTSWCGDNDLGLLEQEVDTWKTLHGEIGREYGSGITLNSYLIHLDLASKEARPGSDSLRCMTVHGAKGLEFKHVYLIGMAQEVFPSFQALRKGRRSRQLEEERRNCFVAITRAEETLTLTRSRTYYGYAKGPSQFLSEMGL